MEHHDEQLCKRLARKIMGWNESNPHPGVDQYWEDVTDDMEPVVKISAWDPCCDPAHSWMLEQKMAELGWSYDWISFEAIQEGQKSHLGDAFFQKDDESKEKYVMIGANRLHATALAAIATTRTKIEQTQTR